MLEAVAALSSKHGEDLPFILFYVAKNDETVATAGRSALGATSSGTSNNPHEYVDRRSSNLYCAPGLQGTLKSLLGFP